MKTNCPECCSDRCVRQCSAHVCLACGCEFLAPGAMPYAPMLGPLTTEVLIVADIRDLGSCTRFDMLCARERARYAKQPK